MTSSCAHGLPKSQQRNAHRIKSDLKSGPEALADSAPSLSRTQTRRAREKPGAQRAHPGQSGYQGHSYLPSRGRRSRYDVDGSRASIFGAIPVYGRAGGRKNGGPDPLNSQSCSPRPRRRAQTREFYNGPIRRGLEGGDKTDQSKGFIKKLRPIALQRAMEATNSDKTHGEPLTSGHPRSPPASSRC